MAAADKLTKLKHLRQLAEKVQSDYALKSSLPTKVSDLENDSNFQTGTQVSDAISAAVAGALIPGGSVQFADLPALAKANCNHIYNISDKFTTTADFLEGAGVAYPAGTNVAIINTGTTSSPVYKYDTYTGTFDFSGFAEKVSGATSGNFAALDTNGNLTDSGKNASSYSLVAVDTEGDGTISIDGTSKTVVSIATDQEVTAMMTEVFGE